MKRIADFKAYEFVLPYASEIFGVYQPMLGWKSKRQIERLERGFSNDIKKASLGLLAKFQPEIDVRILEQDRFAEIGRVAPATLNGSRLRSTGTFVGQSIAEKLPPLDEYDESAWDFLSSEQLTEILTQVAVPQIMEWQRGAAVGERGGDNRALMVADQVAHESALSGLVLHLKDTQQFDLLKDLFYKPDLDLSKLIGMLKFRDPLDFFDPFTDIDRAGLSPIGIVHLFRQYFYEFDTFLGSPVGHVWMSPGSVVELMEVTTRRTLVEKTMETATESVIKTELSTTEEDEISDAVKEDNRSDTKFGMNSTVNQGWIGGSASASASLNLDSTQAKARENTHRRMRSQTEKLSTEIRKNFKSTFRTVTETTDTSSKRYVLNNTTDKLLNYELRRKMRQVGVQVQDIGTYLCWQTYVDDPGRQLGISKLVHIAKDPELGAIPPPESVPQLSDHITSHNVDIPFVPKTEDTEPDEDMDEAYADGVEVNTDTAEGTPEKVQWVFHDLRAPCDVANYQYAGIDFDYGGNDVQIEVIDVDTSTAGLITYGIKLRHVNFRNNPNLRVVAKVTWTPSDAIKTEIEEQNKANVATFNEATRREFQKAFVEASRDRINKASRVHPRPFEDLREEERIVVYRALIQDMLTKGIPMPDDRTRHVVSELLNTIFDIDKMLYFVAPEWWRPRLHRSHQVLGGAPPNPAPVNNPPAKTGSVFSQAKLTSEVGVYTGQTYKKMKAAATEDTTIPSTNVVAWGGTDENRADNYYITEDSDPAKLGSSLGWLLQLDGDNMRNAFLNAPWVKAVIPVRPGKERAAINWLQRVHVEGADGLDNLYVAPASELADIPHEGAAPTIRDAINYLCDRVAAKHEDAQKVDAYPTEEINDDNKVLATPIDKVFEHGFYPLQGGFRVTPGEEQFEIFDQWVEVLPTDQVVPVEVTYDPKTGRQL